MLQCGQLSWRVFKTSTQLLVAGKVKFPQLTQVSKSSIYKESQNPILTHYKAASRHGAGEGTCMQKGDGGNRSEKCQDRGITVDCRLPTILPSLDLTMTSNIQWFSYSTWALAFSWNSRLTQTVGENDIIGSVIKGKTQFHFIFSLNIDVLSWEISFNSGYHGIHSFYQYQFLLTTEHKIILTFLKVREKASA